MTTEHLDVLVIGAGLSGIGAAYHLQTRLPGRTYAILEGRDAIGGTWDLFRYPGVRSDSDMYTLGYRFKPWRDPKAIADGPAIRAYIRETAAEHGIDRRIRFGHRVVRAEWSTADARWTVEALRADGTTARLTCGFLYACTGYYDYEQGYTPEWPGRERFRGRIVHPQHWPEDLDWTGQRVVVIGSGATAVTIVPAMAERAAHVTMLQRSPTYVVTRPARDVVANGLRRVLPARAAYAASRWKNVLLGMGFFTMARRRPALTKRLIMKGVRQELGAGYDVDTHFAPRYDPWDERLCLVPDADLFAAIRSGRASMATDHIETFTERGLQLRSGAELEADLIVTATGLNLRLLHGLALVVDGAPVELARTMAYRGMMYSDVPNFAQAFGYTNASWTLKVDLTSDYVCRLLSHMRRHGYVQCTPRRTDPSVREEPVLDFTSGYVRRALDTLPRQGSRPPWRVHQNYVRDLLALRYAGLDDGVMEFRRAAPGASAAPGAEAATVAGAGAGA
jgi:cation diffusion facilitator CzcD-associated flavoprotein CzcO